MLNTYYLEHEMGGLTPWIIPPPPDLLLMNSNYFLLLKYKEA